MDASALAGARGYLQITVRNYRAIAITTRWRSRLRGQSKSEAFGRFELFECLIAGSYEHARAEFRLPRIVHTPLDAMQFTAGTEPSPPRSQGRPSVGLRGLGSNLCALCEKKIFFRKARVLRAKRRGPLQCSLRSGVVSAVQTDGRFCPLNPWSRATRTCAGTRRGSAPSPEIFSSKIPSAASTPASGSVIYQSFSFSFSFSFS